MDWRDVGNKLFAEVREQWLAYAAGVLNGTAADLNVPGLQASYRPVVEYLEASPGFIAAVYAWENGRPDDLIEYLRSDRPINKRDRSRLVGGIRTMSGRPNHRPARHQPKFAASLAVALYKEWCSRNRGAHVSSRGYARIMQGDCADFIALILTDVDAEHIYALMNDKKERRTTDSNWGWQPWKVISRLKPHQETFRRKYRQK